MAEFSYVGVDPGLTKCGYARVASDGRRLSIEVVPTAALGERLKDDAQTGSVRMVCVGDATTSAKAVAAIRSSWPQAPVTVVDERHTTLEARRMYYEDHPPRGLWRLLPRGLLVPSEPLDGYAALLIVQRYLAALRSADTTPKQSP